MGKIFELQIKRCKPKGLNLLFGIIFYPMLSYSASDLSVWQNIGPEGGEISNIVYSRSEPGIVYSTSGEILYKSVNSGRVWSQVKKPVAGDYFISHLLVDSAQPNNLISLSESTRSSILKNSTDGGQNWNILSNEGIDLPSLFSINQNFKSTLIGQKQILADALTIAESHDLGTSWSDTDISTDKSIFLRAIYWLDSNVMYASVFESGSDHSVFSKSNDGGNSWFSITPGFAQGTMYDLLIHPKDRQLLFASYRSELTAPLSAATDKMMSRDGGQTWESLAISSRQLIMDPTDLSTLYSIDFEDYIDGPAGATYSIDRLFKTSDAGNSWQPISFDKELIFRSIESIAVNPHNNDELLLGTGNSLLSSIDGGQSWQLSQKGIQNTGGELTIARSDPSVMYLWNKNKPFSYRSFDAGVHWEIFYPKVTETGYIPDCSQLVINAKQTTEIICFDDNIAYKSLDAGDQWQLIYKKTGKHLEINSYDGMILYAKAGNKIYKSLDNAQTWFDISIKPAENTKYHQVLTDPLHTNIIYALASSDGDLHVY